MKRILSSMIPMVGLFAALSLRAEPDTAPLQAGQMLPPVSGQTLTGKTLDLPAAAAGKPSVVVFSFSKAAGKDSRLWSERLTRDAPAVADYTIIELESLPKLLRGMVLSSIKGGMPPQLQERTIVLYHDAALWKQRLACSDDDRAYVILLGPDGHMRWKNDGPFSEPSYAVLRKNLDQLH
jgi:hypothetical protein